MPMPLSGLDSPHRCWSGIVTSRRIIGVPVLVDADTEKLVATVAPAIQQILVGAPSQTGGIEKGTGA